MKKTTVTKYVAGKWECWKDEKYSHWYIGETGTNTYLAQTYSEANARLIVAAKEMYKLMKIWVNVQAQPMLRDAKAQAEELLAQIDGEQVEA